MEEGHTQGAKGWPGEPTLEGRTPHRIPLEAIRKDGGKGPAEITSPVFHNIAMADQRTRSVLIMDAAIEEGLLGEKDVRVLDLLTGSGIRARRWLHECMHAERLTVTCNDFESEALQWASAVHALHPPLAGRLQFTQIDARRWYERGYQWIDIDPFGSPAPFIDAALSSMGRRGILALTATDAAALRGSSDSACSRRYAARVKQGPASHEIGLRVLIGWAALKAAMHDRTIRPLISTCDDHYLRITLLIERSPSRASAWREQIGWCIESPRPGELDMAIWPQDASQCQSNPPLRILLPWHYPPVSIDERVSGPLWIGSLNDDRILSHFDEEKILLKSGILLDSEDQIRVERDRQVIEDTGFKTNDVNSHNSKIRLCVRRRKDLLGLGEAAMWIGTDELASHLGLTGPPALEKLIEQLRERGELVAPGLSGRPGIVTSAPWSEITTIAANISPKKH